MYLAKIPVRRADGTKRFYYVLRNTKWSKEEKRPIQYYVAYIGPRPMLALKKAKKIAKRAGISLDELRQVKGLKIVDEQERAK